MKQYDVLPGRLTADQAEALRLLGSKIAYKDGQQWHIISFNAQIQMAARRGVSEFVEIKERDMSKGWRKF